MQLDVRKLTIPDCLELFPKILRDERGYFVKTFHFDVFQELGLETDFKEEYYSYSIKRVLRGLHFQIPPKDHVKVVYCIYGKILDVVVDLRIGSPTYGHYEMIELSSDKANMIYIPKGLAHGFYTLSDFAIVVYKVTTTYSPDHDTGILWNSLNIPWPDEKPIISRRDSGFIPFADFNSPFIYQT
ncbi:MAG: dTDP-4-dehydrorhamnose 3,5-epimerase [Thermodesulfovibrio sp.]|nr:dTDP-4-dehydrorhamnose 3,5-epimerase [Thermodesulfovibrio sp.]